MRRGRTPDRTDSTPVERVGGPAGESIDTRSPAAVRRSLRALADGTAPEGGGGVPYHRVVREATDALDSVETAAAVFGDDPRRLRRAVAAADRLGDEEVAARGRRVLDVLARYRRLAAPCRRCGSETPDQDRDGRGTVLPGDGQSRDR